MLRMTARYPGFIRAGPICSLVFPFRACYLIINVCGAAGWPPSGRFFFFFDMRYTSL